jgi:serine/threonine protein kinase
VSDVVAAVTLALADRYRVERELGGGGMSRVFVATEIGLDRQVVLKLLSPDLAEGLSADRFAREIRLVARMQHPNIVPLLSAGTADHLPWYTMPFVRGDSLRVRLAAGALDQRAALRVIGDVARALAYAHDMGILHRDIKPENVLLSEGVAVVTDFGIAKAIAAARADRSEGGESDSKTALTALGSSIGTPGYMSPEQALGDVDVDARADLYALGVVAYELLAGRHPFANRRTVQQLVIAHLTEVPVALETIVQGLAPAVSAIVMQCLEKDPAARPANAAAVLDALDAAVSAPRAADAVVRTPDSGATTPDADFWIAVLPFRHRDSSGELSALAEGLAEEIVTGLSRFSYLRIVAHSSTMRFASDSADVREVGRALGARYVIEGTLRLAGRSLRVSVQLVDTSSGAHLWAETYDRAFDPANAFALQDELVPRIVATVADPHGVLLRRMSDELRTRSVDEMTPFDAALRCRGYYTRISPAEHAEVRGLLEHVVERWPGAATCWPMLAMVYIDEYRNSFNTKPNARERAMAAARRGVETDPSEYFTWHALAVAQFCGGDLVAFSASAQRAVALNPYDSENLAALGTYAAYGGDWDQGCKQVARARELNPNFPGWYWFADGYNAYRKGEFRVALDAALRVNMPRYFYSELLLAAIYGQLGDTEGSQRSAAALLTLVPGIASVAREELRKWFDEALTERVIEGLRKAGMTIDDGPRMPDAGSIPQAARL